MLADPLCVDLRDEVGLNIAVRSYGQIQSLTSFATSCLTANLDTAMSAARFPSYVTNTSTGLTVN